MRKNWNAQAKALTVFVFSLCAIGLFIPFSLVAVQICRKWYGFAVGMGIMLAAIPFHCKGKKRPWCYFASFAMNSVAAGFVVSAYYLEKEIALNVYSLLQGAVPAAALMLLTFVLLQSFPNAKKVSVTVVAILNAALAVSAVVLWIVDGGVVCSFGFFCLLMSSFYLCVFGVTVNHDERFVLRDVSLGSFGAFFIIATVVLLILLEGELLDGLDPGSGGGGKRRKRIKKT